MVAQLAPGVVQGLVESVAVRVQPFGKDVDRHLVQGESDEDSSLVRRQDFGYARLQGLDELGLFGLDRGRRCGAGDRSPSLWLERDLASLPRALAELDGCFVDGELEGPG